MIYLGYDRMSSGDYWQHHDARERSLRHAAEADGIELAGTLVHISRNRGDSRRFEQIVKEMKKVGANAIFTTFEDRLAPRGWGQWPDKHHLIRSVPVLLSKAGQESEASSRRRGLKHVYELEQLFINHFSEDDHEWAEFQRAVRERRDRIARVRSWQSARAQRQEQAS